MHIIRFPLHSLPHRTDTTWEISFKSSTFPAPSLAGTQLSFKNLLAVPCTGGGKVTAPINIQFKIRGSSAPCFPYQYLSCLNDTLVYNCPGVCPRGGLSGNRFSFMRTNYGLGDNNNDGIPDGALDMSKVRTDLLLAGDTAAAISSAKVVAGAVNFTYGYFEPSTSQFAVPDGNFNVIDGSLKIYRNNVLLGTCTGLPLTKTTTNQWRMDYSVANLSGCIPGYTQFTDGDSLVAQIRYVNYRLPDIFVGNTVVSAKIMGDFYISDKANPAVADRYSCDSSYASLQLLPSGILEAGGLNYSMTGCNSLLYGNNAYLSIGTNVYSNDYYWFEYRPVTLVDRVKFTLPAGVKWNGVAQIPSYGGNINLTSGSYPYNISSLATVYADSVVFNIRNIWADKGGPFAVPDEGYVLPFQIGLLPSACASGSVSVPVGMQSYFSTVSSPFYTTATVNVINPVAVSAPIVTVTAASPTQTVTGNTVSWELQISNAASVAAANFSWLAQAAGGTTTIQKIEKLSGPGGTVVSTLTPVNSMYQLGTLNAGSNSYYRVTAGFANCVTDTLNLKYSYDCSAYPTSPAAATCSYSTQQLLVIPQPAMVQLQILSQPVGQQTLCTDTSYTLQLTSVQPGSAFNPVVSATLPASGFVINSGSSTVEYPAGVFTTIPDPVLVNGKYQWDIGAAIPSLNTTGLALNQNLKLSFTAKGTDCSYTSGDYLSFQARAKNGCGADINTLMTTSNPFVLLNDPGLNVNNFLLSKQVSTRTVMSCGSNTITYTYIAKNNGPTPSTALKEALVIDAPNWLTAAGSITAIHNSPADAQRTTVPGTGIITYSWPMPDAIAVGDSVKFSIDFTVNTAIAPICADNNYIIRNYVTNKFSTPAPCVPPDFVCESKTIKGLDTAQFALVNYRPQATSVTLSYPNQCTLQINNAGSISIPSGAVNYTIYADMNNNAQLDAGDVALTSGLTLPATAAGGNYNTTLNLNPLPTGTSGQSVLLVVENGTCNCRSVVQSVGVLPLKLISFTAEVQNCTAALQWVTTEEVKVAGFDIERSSDGANYGVIAKVKATGTAGNAQNTYHYADKTLEGAHTYYYRLRSWDNDGRSTYSPVVTAKATGCNVEAPEMIVYPNPVRQSAELAIKLSNLSAGRYDLMLRDMHGRVIRLQSLNIPGGNKTNVYYMDTKGLAAGVYVANLYGSSSVSNINEHVKVIVEK